MRVLKNSLAVVLVFLAVFGVSPGFSQCRDEPVESTSRRRWTDEDLAEAVKKSRTVNQVFKHLGLRVGGSQWEYVKRRIVELDLDVSHFRAVQRAAEASRPRVRAPATTRRGSRH